MRRLHRMPVAVRALGHLLDATGAPPSIGTRADVPTRIRSPAGVWMRNVGHAEPAQLVEFVTLGCCDACPNVREPPRHVR